MTDLPGILLGKGVSEAFLYPKMANRHGLIAGATGTGKTVTLKVLAEAFSSIGVPVFLADIKGDLAGMCLSGEGNQKVEERVKALELKDFKYQIFPSVYWDVFGKLGHPVRTTISEMGPLLIARLLDLNETQTGVLNIVFKIADDTGMLLNDLNDLKAMLRFAGDNASQYTTEYGTISKQSVGAIQRGLLTLEEQGGEQFFGEPGLDIFDLIKTDQNGLGNINILSAEQLFNSPKVYSTFLLWLLSELFEELPEAGDLAKPKIVFFFDEAHLLFNDAPKILLDKIEQVVRLIRSKGVGVYFITQNPIDIPEKVLGQLGNRVQHALRAFTPRDQKAVKAAAETFRSDGTVDVEKVITELKVGEALISCLDTEGRPSIVQQVFVVPPKSKIGTIDMIKRTEMINSSVYMNKYEAVIDRESAYEMLQRKIEHQSKLQKEEALAKDAEKARQAERRYDYDTVRKTPSRTSPGRKKDTAVEKMAKSAMSTFSRQIGRELVRGILGSLL
ncbi:MAG: DUF853 family protein, partial [Eubacteriaceae bacterium]|nr:DUF853 family protein [Eubacteriaceae bacterium]